MLAEMARVTEAGGSVLAGVFAATGSRHAAAAVVDQWPTAGLGGAGVVRPAEGRPRAPSPAAATLLPGCGRPGSRAHGVDVEVDAGLDTAGALVDWRLGTPPWPRS